MRRCSYDPRAMLERAAGALFCRARSDARRAHELEFYLIDEARDDKGRLQPPFSPRSQTSRDIRMSVYGLRRSGPCYQELPHRARSEAAATQRVPMSATSKEYAPGQFRGQSAASDGERARRLRSRGLFCGRLVQSRGSANKMRGASFEEQFSHPDRSGLRASMCTRVWSNRSGRNVFDNGTAGGERVAAALRSAAWPR